MFRSFCVRLRKSFASITSFPVIRFRAILAVPAASATTATAATSTLAFLMLGRAAALDLRLDLFIEFFFGDVLFLFNDRRVSYDIRRTRTARFNRHPRAFGFPIRQDGDLHTVTRRSEEHTSELQSLMRI